MKKIILFFVLFFISISSVFADTGFGSFVCMTSGCAVDDTTYNNGYEVTNYGTNNGSVHGPQYFKSVNRTGDFELSFSGTAYHDNVQGDMFYIQLRLTDSVATNIDFDLRDSHQNNTNTSEATRIIYNNSVTDYPGLGVDVINDSFEISRVGNTISFYRNGILKHSLTNSNTITDLKLSFWQYQTQAYPENYLWNYYDTDNPAGPPALSLLSSGSLDVRSDLNGVDISGFSTNTGSEYSMLVQVDDITNGIPFVEYSNLGSFSGGLFDFSLLSDVDFTFNQPIEYDLFLYLTDLNDPTNQITVEYNFRFEYTIEYVAPTPENWNFGLIKYGSLTNGFIFEGFSPNPYGGRLFFEIISPHPTGTGTLTNYTSTGSYYSNQYGLSTKLYITDPYHNVPGQYNVRSLYEYDGETVYPFGTGYYSYVITEPGSSVSLSEQLENCDVNLDGLVDLNEKLSCIVGAEDSSGDGIFDYIKNFIDKVSSLFKEVEQMASPVDSKDFLNYIIPGTYAENNVIATGLLNNTVNTGIQDQAVLKNSYTLLYSTLIFGVFLLLFGIIYSIRK